MVTGTRLLKNFAINFIDIKFIAQNPVSWFLGSFLSRNYVYLFNWYSCFIYQQFEYFIWLIGHLKNLTKHWYQQRYVIIYQIIKSRSWMPELNVLKSTFYDQQSKFEERPMPCPWGGLQNQQKYILYKKNAAKRTR